MPTNYVCEILSYLMYRIENYKLDEEGIVQILAILFVCEYFVGIWLCSNKDDFFLHFLRISIQRTLLALFVYHISTYLPKSEDENLLTNKHLENFDTQMNYIKSENAKMFELLTKIQTQITTNNTSNSSTPIIMESKQNINIKVPYLFYMQNFKASVPAEKKKEILEIIETVYRKCINDDILNKDRYLVIDRNLNPFLNPECNKKYVELCQSKLLV